MQPSVRHPLVENTTSEVRKKTSIVEAPAAAGRHTPRFSIPARIFFGFLVVLGAFGGLGTASLLRHRQSSRTLTLLHEGYLPLTLTVGEARATQVVFTTQIDRVLEEQDRSATRSWLDVARRVRPVTVQRALADAERALRLSPSNADLGHILAVRSALRAVDRAFSSSDAAYTEFFAALKAGNRKRAEQLLASLRVQERGIQRRLRTAWTELQDRMAAMSMEAAQRERSAALWLGLLSVVALCVGGLVAWWARRILRPLPLLQARVAAVARGDLSRRLEPQRDDEIGRLTTEFERMVDSLALRDAELREAAETLTRLQRMQERIIASLRSAVVVVGEGCVRTVNVAAKAVLGLRLEDVGERAHETALTRIEGLIEAIDEVVAGTDRVSLVAVPVSETDRFVDALVIPFPTSETADVRGALIIADDVTEELSTKERLIHTERLAAIGRMAAHVTHELRNPLSSIGLNVEMLEEELANAGADAEAKTLLLAVQREIERLTSITEEYLRLARQPEPRLASEDAGAVVAGVLALVRREMELCDLQVSFHLEDDLPPVSADERQLRQALLNLLRNAREAMPSGGRIVVGVTRSGRGVQIRIADQGAGIADEERERIFDLFYTTKERGTGLGLPLTKQIIAAQGGTIRVGSTPGGGTTFDIWLPSPVLESAG